MDKKQAIAHVEDWTQGHIEPEDRERFRETVEDELLGLHEGNFARYQLRPSEFTAWRDVWNTGPGSLAGVVNWRASISSRAFMGR
jgi:hypothetical protein